MGREMWLQLLAHAPGTGLLPQPTEEPRQGLGPQLSLTAVTQSRPAAQVYPVLLSPPGWIQQRSLSQEDRCLSDPARGGAVTAGGAGADRTGSTGRLAHRSQALALLAGGEVLGGGPGASPC